MPAAKKDEQAAAEKADDLVNVRIRLHGERAKAFTSRGPVLNGSVVALPRAEAEALMAKRICVEWQYVRDDRGELTRQRRTVEELEPCVETSADEDVHQVAEDVDREAIHKSNIEAAGGEAA